MTGHTICFLFIYPSKSSDLDPDLGDKGVSTIPFINCVQNKNAHITMMMFNGKFRLPKVRETQKATPFQQGYKGCSDQTILLQY